MTDDPVLVALRTCAKDALTEMVADSLEARGLLQREEVFRLAVALPEPDLVHGPASCAANEAASKGFIDRLMAECEGVIRRRRRSD